MGGVQAMVEMPQGLILSPQVRGLYKSFLTLSPPGRAERNTSWKSLPSLGSPGPESGEGGVWGTAVEPLLGPSEHRAEGTRQGSRPGFPAETAPPTDTQGQAHSTPCCLRVQTHCCLGGTSWSRAERETLWTSACLAHHPTPHRAGVSHSPGVPACAAGATTPQSLLQRHGLLRMNHAVLLPPLS